jgi:hypothetical protein
VIIRSARNCWRIHCQDRGQFANFRGTISMIGGGVRLGTAFSPRDHSNEIHCARLVAHGGGGSPGQVKLWRGNP